MAGQVKQQISIHVLPIRVTFLNTGLYLGSLNPRFLKELGDLMVKWQVVHLEVAIVPCMKDQKIEITTKGEEEPAGEGAGSPFGP